MMSIDAWHPEVKTFVTIKENPNEINKANLSVEIDDKFMNSLEYGTCRFQEETDYNGIEDRCKKKKKVFHAICESAWRSGEPGVLVVDRLRKYNVMGVGDGYQRETTDPCGGCSPQ